MGDIPYILLRIATPGKQVWQVLEVRNGFNVIGTLFFAEGAVAVRSDADVQCISRQLTDVVHVID